jgi:alpha-D-ribose 1-methylphosphonate 5-triphosphate synthase subunit PhnG
MCVGRDLEQSMGMAVLDAALRANVARAMITAFISAQQQAQQADDEALLQQVAATRVEMETF